MGNNNIDTDNSDKHNSRTSERETSVKEVEGVKPEEEEKESWFRRYIITNRQMFRYVMIGVFLGSIGGFAQYGWKFIFPSFTMQVLMVLWLFTANDTFSTIGDPIAIYKQDRRLQREKEREKNAKHA